MNNIKTAVNDIKNFTLLQLALTDQDGDILDLNGCHWSMTLQIDYTY
jgi:hypothetical protein